MIFTFWISLMAVNNLSPKNSTKKFAKNSTKKFALWRAVNIPNLTFQENWKPIDSDLQTKTPNQNLQISKPNESTSNSSKNSKSSSKNLTISQTNINPEFHHFLIQDSSEKATKHQNRDRFEL